MGWGAGTSSTEPVPLHASSQPVLTPCHNSSATQLLQNAPLGLKAFTGYVSSACFLLCWGLVRRIQALLNHFRDKHAASSVVTCPLDTAVASFRAGWLNFVLGTLRLIVGTSLFLTLVKISSSLGKLRALDKCCILMFSFIPTLCKACPHRCASVPVRT